MRIALIHNEKKIGTGAHYINDLMSQNLRSVGVEVKHYYPQTELSEDSFNLKGIQNILFFHSLLEKKASILKCDLIQGTTYTPIAFLPFSVPVVTHFGSTTAGFLKNVPQGGNVEEQTRKVWSSLKDRGIINDLDGPSRRPIRDIADIEMYVAKRARGIIATSAFIRHELLEGGVLAKNIRIIHNAIEDYWFDTKLSRDLAPQRLVFLGRLGNDPFTLKLKGLDRLIYLYHAFPRVEKATFCITNNQKLAEWLPTFVPNHRLFHNVIKDQVPKLLENATGNILFISSRYEGFSLSLVEGMSQGMIPVAFPVGIVPEIIRHGQNGFIVNDVDEAVRIVGNLLAEKYDRKALAKAARKTAERFTSARMAKELKAYYDSLLRPSLGKRIKSFFTKNK